MSDRTPAGIPDDRDPTSAEDDGIGEAADLARLDRLGLAVLADGPAPGGAGLADVRARARRHRRRRWAPAAAAAVLVLLVAGAAVALTRGDESGVSVDTPSEAEQYLIPPADAEDVGYRLGLDGVYADPAAAASEYQKVSFYTFQFATPEGTTARLTVGRRSSTPGTDPSMAIVGASELGTLLGVPASFPQVEVSEGAVRAIVTCAGTDASGQGVVGPVAVRGAVGSWTFLLSEGPESDGTTPCDLTPASTSAATALLRSLRVVDAATWGRYLADHASSNTLDSGRPVDTSPPTTAGG
jgi:hypothetical protein